MHCLPLIRGWVAEATGSGGKPDIPLPSNTVQLLLGDLKEFQGQKGHIIPPARSGSAPRPPPSWTCPKNLQREATRLHPNQMPEPPQWTSFWFGFDGAAALLQVPSGWPELLTLSLRLSPATLRRTPFSAICIHDLILLVTTQILWP